MKGAHPTISGGRDRDYFQRDYMLKHGEQPQYATPPKDFSPNRYSGPGSYTEPGGVSEFGGHHTVNIDEWVLIFIE
jgi:hypothetical protein